MASYDFLFRVLFNEDISISYPKDNVVSPSNSKWTESTVVHLHSEKNLLDYAKGKIVKKNRTKSNHRDTSRYNYKSYFWRRR